MIDTAVRNLIRQRAGERCEYCRLPEHAVDIPFHVEHIIAKQHGGEDDPSNLCLACDRCNLYKGPNLSSVDPETPSAALLRPAQDREKRVPFWFVTRDHRLNRIVNTVRRGGRSVRPS